MFAGQLEAWRSDLTNDFTYRSLTFATHNLADHAIESIEHQMAEHKARNHILARYRQHTLINRLWVRGGVKIQPIRVGFDIATHLGAQIPLIVRVQRLPDSKPVHQKVCYGAVLAYEQPVIPSIKGHGFLNQLPIVFSLRIGETKGRICIGLAQNMRYTADVATNRYIVAILQIEIVLSYKGLLGTADEHEQQASRQHNLENRPHEISPSLGLQKPHRLPQRLPREKKAPEKHRSNRT